MTQALPYGSLCTGYDGIGMGLALAGVPVRPLYFAEDEDAMARVLKREHDDVPNVGDIKAAPWGLAPRVAIMSSGDPCQSISVAGRRAGREDPRFLWPWVRIAYRETQPDVLFFENVANIVPHDGGRTLAERHGHLREDGYEVRWALVGACAVGAPHHRHRYFAVAARWRGTGLAPEARRMDGGKAICGAPRSGGRFLLPTPAARDHKGALDGKRDGGPNFNNVVQLLPTPDASMSTRGGMLSPAMALVRIANPMRSSNLDDVVASLLTTGAPRLGAAMRPETWGKYAEAVALWEKITGVPAPVPTEPGAKGAPRLSPKLPEWMMGLRPGLLTDELSRPEALKGAGNGVVPLAAAAAWRLLTAE